MQKYFIVLLASAVFSTAGAADQPPLPEPLTLEAAIGTLDDGHPLIADATARRSLAEADLDNARSGDDLTLDLTLQARRVNNIDHSFDLDIDDSRAILTLRKTLYDFGRTGHGVSAGEVLLEARTASVLQSQQQQRQEIMRRFFDVILSDLDAARSNEAMSIAFIRSDDAKERQELGVLSDIDVLELETRYQEALMQRNRAQDVQRQTRAQLALAMNRPEDLVDTIEPPQLTGLKNPLPEYDALLEEMQLKDLTLKTAALERQSRVEQKKSAKAAARPQLFVELEAAEYRRDLGSQDPLTAILGLDVPLYQGARTSSKVAQRDAEIAQLDAQTHRIRYALRQELLEVWQEIAILQRQLEQANTLKDFRDLDLDRSRARYELEMDTNFGNAMTQQSAAKLFSAKTEYELALARERLVELTQNPSYSALAAEVAQPKEEDSQ